MNEPEQKVVQAELCVDIPAPPCTLYFLAACYKGRWSIRTGDWNNPDSQGIKQSITSLQDRGWSNIKICKLTL